MVKRGTNILLRQSLGYLVNLSDYGRWHFSANVWIFKSHKKDYSLGQHSLVLVSVWSVLKMKLKALK